MPVEKICVDCKQLYTPTGKYQLRCSSCKGAKKVASREIDLSGEHEITPKEIIASVNANKVYVRESGPRPNLEALALNLLNLSGCKCLNLDYVTITVQINQK
jgi:hypothetical protein